MQVTRRSYSFRIQPPMGHSRTYDWSSGSPVAIETPVARPAYDVAATGDDVEAARRMAADQYGVSVDAVTPLLDEEGAPKYREYVEDVRDNRSLRQRGRDGEDGFGR